MPEKPKIEPKEIDEKGDHSTWSEDQKKRGYYYDDAHGYEDFDPDSELDEFEDEQDENDVEGKSRI